MSVADLFKGYSGEIDFTKFDSDYAAVVTTSIQANIAYYKDQTEFPDINDQFIQNCAKLNEIAAGKVSALFEKNKAKFGFLPSAESVCSHLGSLNAHPRTLQVIDKGLGAEIRLVDIAFLREKLNPTPPPRVEID
jgi:hypothetical protein